MRVSRSSAPRAPGRVRALGVAALLVAGLSAGVLPASPASAQAADPPLAVGETDKSRNMRLVTNLPKNGAFASEGAYNSDLAFSGEYVFAGNYNGFTVYDASKRRPKQVVQVECIGAQNDITVYEDLLFLSVDSRRTDDSCSSGAATAAQSASGAYWEGIRIFDISDPTAPKYIKAVETDCGSHTHTLVPGDDAVYLYVSSYGPATNQAKCQPPHDKISVVEVPLDAPTTASVVAEPVLFPGGGNPGRPATPEVPAGPGTPGVPAVPGYSATSGCHDITAYPEKGIAAGACMGEGVIIDITDPIAPEVTETVLDTENFAFWHSATFNNEADSVIFTDELGGGGAPTCNPTVGPHRGANGIYSLTGGQLDFESYYKISRTQADTENCVAHNGSLIPVKSGNDVMVQAWYQGGISVFDFTDPAAPTEIAYYDRGPLAADRLVLGGSWSAYYNDGYIYSNDIQKGLDVFDVRDARTVPDRSVRDRSDTFNPQTQPSF